MTTHHYDDDLAFEDDSDGDCSFCGGDGERECDDFIQCMGRHATLKLPDGYVVYFCKCTACGGSGAARDQTIW